MASMGDKNGKKLIAVKKWLDRKKQNGGHGFSLGVPLTRRYFVSKTVKKMSEGRSDA